VSCVDKLLLFVAMFKVVLGWVNKALHCVGTCEAAAGCTSKKLLFLDAPEAGAGGTNDVLLFVDPFEAALVRVNGSMSIAAWLAAVEIQSSLWCKLIAGGLGTPARGCVTLMQGSNEMAGRTPTG
jgi:hypothetical protein